MNGRLSILIGLVGLSWLCVSAQAQRAHWSFVPPVRTAVPGSSSSTWTRNPIDAFVLHRLQGKRFSPSPPADRRTLLRRVSFDLTGLPPTPPEIASFVGDRKPGAYDRVVNRLLGSHHFGERWAQHWLDVVRFAETNGYELDAERPQAWRYRDWVIRSLNRDMPYDQFLTEQIAGDLLRPNDSEAQTATGFLRAGPAHVVAGNLDPKELRQEWLTEAVNGIGNGVLGLTVGCARCHDHKFDPVSQADYYRLQAFFGGTANHEYTHASEDEKKAHACAQKAISEAKKPIEAKIAAIERPYRDRIAEAKRSMLAAEFKAALAVPEKERTLQQKRLADNAKIQLNISWDEVLEVLSPTDRATRGALRQEIFALERTAPEPLRAAIGVKQAQMLKPTHILVRGDPNMEGEAVQAGFPVCLVATEPKLEGNAAQRIRLARWIASPANPLTSRVIVNRVWQHLIGRGLVSTPNDFGRHGEAPTHPELLDWLASELPQRKWRLKSLIAMIVTSNTYRQASDSDPSKARIDPNNRLLWRMNRKRLDAESLRDAMLAASGRLNPDLYGPSVFVPLEPEVYDTIFTEAEPDNLWTATVDERQHTRRTIYLHRKRNVRLPLMMAFDQPDFVMSCAARGATTHPLQALTLLNGDFTRRAAGWLASNVMKGEADSDAQRIDRLFTLTLGRPPLQKERISTERFVTTQRVALGSRAAAWTDLCHAVLNLNDFVYQR